MLRVRFCLAVKASSAWFPWKLICVPTVSLGPGCKMRKLFSHLLYCDLFYIVRAANLMTCNHVRDTKKMSEMEAWDMLVEIKYCGSSTVTNNEQKHSQNVMATIFSSGCYAPYIYTIIAAPLHFLRVPLSSIFCSIVALGPSIHYRPLRNLGLQLHATLITPSWFRPAPHVGCPLVAVPVCEWVDPKI